MQLEGLGHHFGHLPLAVALPAELQPGHPDRDVTLKLPCCPVVYEVNTSDNPVVRQAALP